MSTIKNKITIWFFLHNLIFLRSDSKSYSLTSSALSYQYDFYFIILWMHYTLSISVFRRNEVNSYCNWIFHVSDFLRLFMVSFKYGLLSSSVPWSTGFYFYHHYFHIRCNCTCKCYLLLLVCKNLLLAQKGS